MSDRWIYQMHLTLVIVGQIARATILTQDLPALTGLDSLADRPAYQQQVQPMLDSRDLAARTREIQAAPTREQVTASREDPVQAERGSGEKEKESPAREALETLDEMDHALEEQTKEREPESGQVQELLADKQSELKELLAEQKKERETQEKLAKEARAWMEERHADSPDRQETLDKFEKALGAADDDLSRRQAAELQQFQERWQEKSRQQEEQPAITPNDPNRDHR